MTRLSDAKKIQHHLTNPLAFCEENGILTERLRPIFEPLINDDRERKTAQGGHARRENSSNHHVLHIEERYQAGVFTNEGGLQFDFACWFDQGAAFERRRFFFEASSC